jgi:hypothetical protein
MSRRSGPSGETTAQARARAEAQRAEQHRVRAEALERHFADGVPGGGLIRLNVVSTVAFVVALVVGAANYAERHLTPGMWLALGVSLALFVGGCGATMVALWFGAQRSRSAEFGIGGWFFLADAAPPGVRRTMLGCTVVQLVAGIVAASVRPFSALAFATLSWVWGVGLTGIWGARWGYFRGRRAE